MAKVETPSLGAKSFSCPNCGALAQQYWFTLSPKQLERGKKPSVFTSHDIRDYNPENIEDKEERERTKKFIERLKEHDLTYLTYPYDRGSYWEMHNLHATLCDSCQGWAVWVKEEIVYPPSTTVVEPHEDMPAHVKPNFAEAAAIVDRSSRGAAALLRLCIQRIVMELGQPGKNLNSEIGELVRSGKIDAKIQQALDVVRVVGNEAVHPGQIDFDDNKAIALRLFDLVNVIVETAIAAPKHISKLYETVVSEEKRKEIEKRDAPKAIEKPKD